MSTEVCLRQISRLYRLNIEIELEAALQSRFLPNRTSSALRRSTGNTTAGGKGGCALGHWCRSQDALLWLPN